MSIELYRQNSGSWFGDLSKVLQLLPIPVQIMDPADLSPQRIDDLIHRVRASCVTHLELEIHSIRRLALIWDREEPLEGGEKPRRIHLFFRHYLHRVEIPAHRRSLIKLPLGEYIFASQNPDAEDLGRQRR